MKVLIVGGGGREHALAWKIAQSPLVDKLFCAPGNAGTAQVAENIPLDVSDISSLASFAIGNSIGLTVVGPEAPLTVGIVDFFREKGLCIFGPTKAAAEIEGSKVFAKRLMKKYDIPTAAFEVFRSTDEALRYVEKQGAPLVVKADGLAAGKGVIVCRTTGEARDAIELIMEEKVFGTAGERVIIEEMLQGEEASYIVFTDGRRLLPMPTSQDHKPVYDGDVGPNTGGMGAYSPAPVVTPTVEKLILEKVMAPAVKGMAAEGRLYEGILYAGLMIEDGQPKTLEFNARMGDPETQPLLMRLESDMVPILAAIAKGELSDDLEFKWDSGASVCVVMASGGYPAKYDSGLPICGLDDASAMEDVQVFHAGSSLKDGGVVTAGGRVLGITARGNDIEEAVKRAYETVGLVSWEGIHYRKDIGAKALSR